MKFIVSGWYMVIMPEYVWRDSRTNTILAPGAVQNWPTIFEEALMNRGRAYLEHQKSLMRRLAVNEMQKKNVFLKTVKATNVQTK